MAETDLNFSRYALYVVPQDEAFARFGARWLGWDIANGKPAGPLDLLGLPVPWDQITAQPRRYGLHATIVPPFRLASGASITKLAETAHAFCAQHQAVVIPQLELVQLGRFLALVPECNNSEISDLAANALRACQPFRAALTPAELERYRAKGLSSMQDANLERWGYPYVMEAFRFHITFTGKLSKAEGRRVNELLTPKLREVIPTPLIIDQLALVGEDENGYFHLIEQLSLSAKRS